MEEQKYSPYIEEALKNLCIEQVKLPKENTVSFQSQGVVYSIDFTYTQKELITTCWIQKADYEETKDRLLETEKGAI